MRTLGLLVVVILAACGGSSSGTKSDAHVDVPIDLAPPPDAPAGHYLYVIDHEDVPTNSTQARAYGLDLDGDGTVNNQLGMVLGTLAGMGFDVQGDVNASVDHGTTLLLADLYALDFTTTTGSTFTTYDGATPMPPPCNGSADTTCRHHLAGDGTFTIAATSAHDTPLTGDAVAGTFDDGPGHLEIEGAFFGQGVVAHLDLIGARVRLTGVTATTLGPSILAGAVTMTDINTKLIPAWQMAIQAQVYQDCCGLATSPGGATCNPNGTPACGCIDGSTGKTELGLFDTSPKDCVVTVDEIKNNSLIQALLAPDVTVEGQMALSFGMQVTAVHAGVY